jgi:hypothetical protein
MHVEIFVILTFIKNPVRPYSLLFLFLFSFSQANADHGLENIIVEKYYVSDTNDSRNKQDGFLPSGSVTYRIFVDMLPGYRFQAAYGVPGHQLRFSTTTSFFNNESAGALTANDVKKSQLSDHTVMLDSWLSVGAAAQSMIGILKNEDTSKAIINTDHILQNTNPEAGIPLKERDGMYDASPVSVVTFFGIDSTMLSIFDKQNLKTNGQTFSTENGSWASFGGAIGPLPGNKVLIAQITTDGIFSFELNIQIGTPEGKVENYVARNPVEKEIFFPNLIFSSEKISPVAPGKNATKK